MHRRWKVLNIGGGGGGMFRILGPNFSLAVNWSRRPTPNQCQIITFIALKTGDIAKCRTELKSMLLEIL